MGCGSCGSAGRRFRFESTWDCDERDKRQVNSTIRARISEHAYQSTHITARISQHACHGTHATARISECAHHSTHVRARISEHAYQSSHVTARMSAHACQSTHVPASISRHAYRRRHITEGSESSEGSGSSEGSESREGSDGSDSGESSQDSERSESGERRGCARGPVADRGTRTCSPAPTPPRHGGGIAGCSPRARGSADRRRSAVRAAGSYRAAGVPRGDRVVGLLLYRDRDPVGRSPPGGRRLVRDPNAGRHVPVSHLGVVVRLMVARRW